MLIQVFLGVLLVTAQHYKPPRFHMFYGFVSFITIGLLYSYRYVWQREGLDGAGLRPRRPVHHGPRHPRGAPGGGGSDARRRVLLLFGGRSAEHDVSRATAVAVAQRARSRRSTRSCPSRSRPTGGGCSPTTRVAQLEGARDALPAAFAAAGSPVELPSEPGRAELVPLGVRRRRSRSTWCCRCCTVRTARTAPCRGCSSSPVCRTSAPGVLGSAVGMDKIMMKRAFAAAGLPSGALPRAARRARRRSRSRIGSRPSSACRAS